MSININVHGNPSSFTYKRDKFCDFETAKNEEIKRRKLFRLEQVRQQSKVIAAELRKKVEDEKQHQLHRIQQIKVNELKSWNERNAKKCHEEYRKCLSHVGDAHLAAKKENELSKQLKEQQIKNRKLATKRGNEALQKLRSTQKHSATKSVTPNKENATATVATQVNDSINSNDSPQQLATVGNPNGTLKSPPKTLPKHVDIAYLSLSSSDEDEMFVENHQFRPTVSSVVNISSEDSLSSGLEEAIKSSKYTTNIGNVLFDKSSKMPSFSGAYNPDDFTADTSSKSYSIVNSVPFTTASDFINKYRNVSNERTVVTSHRPTVELTTTKPVIETVPPIPKPSTAPIKSCLRQSSSANVLPKSSKVSTTTVAPKPKPKIIKKNLPSSSTKTSNPLVLPKSQYVPMFNKPSSTKLSIEGQSIGQSVPSSATTNPIIPVSQKSSKVQFYDHINRFSKEYEAPSDIVQRIESSHDQPTAMEAAKLEEQFEAAEADKLLHLKRLSEMRCQQTLEREKVRKDYDLLNSQLEVLSKQNKMHSGSTYQFSDEMIKQQHAKHQQEMNNQFEKILHKPVLITCPRINQKPEPNDNSPLSSSSGFNVGTGAELSSSESCSSYLLGYMDNRSKHLIKDIGEHGRGGGEKTAELIELLDKINQQKEDLLREMRNCNGGDGISSEHLNNLLKSVQDIERKKEGLLCAEISDKENRQGNQWTIERKKLDVREKQLKIKEAKLEQKLQELFLQEQSKNKAGRNVEIQTIGDIKKSNVEICTSKEAVENSLGTSSESCDVSNNSVPPPVKIIIQVNGQRGKKKHKQVNLATECEQDQPKHFQPISDKPGGIYPKTPAKLNATKPVDEQEQQQQQQQHEQHKNRETFEEDSTSTAYKSYPKDIKTDLTKRFNQSKSSNKINPAKPMSKDKIKITTPALGHYITRLLGMSRASIDQLGVSSSTSIDTPGNSIINISDNLATSCDEIIDEERLEKLRRFIDDNHIFLGELENSLKHTSLRKSSPDHEENMKTIERVWMKTLEEKEKEMKKLKHEGNKLREALKRKEQGQLQLQPIKPILKKPTSPKKVQVITNEDNIHIEKHTDKPEPLELEKLTGSYNQRIADLNDMISKVRKEKQRLLENTFSTVSTVSTTDKEQNSTEYLDFAANKQHSGASSQASDLPTLSNKDECISEDNRIKLANSKQIGISRDSGISVSRPLTSSDWRDSPDNRQQLTGGKSVDEQSFEPILANIPKYNYRINPTIEGEPKIDRIIPKENIEKKTPKPPTSLTRYSPQLEQEMPAHELSTIVEVDTPGTSRMNTSIPNETTKQQIIPQFPTFEEYARINNLTNFNPDTSTKAQVDYKKMLELSAGTMNALNYRKNPESINEETNAKPKDTSLELIKQFPTHKDYALGESNLCTSASIEAVQVDSSHIKHTDESDNESLIDVETELRKRNLLLRSFQKVEYYDEDSNNTNKNQSNSKHTAIVVSQSSSSDTLEQAMHKMGLTWAGTMLKKTKEAHALTSTTTTSTSSGDYNSHPPKQNRPTPTATNSFVDPDLANVTSENDPFIQIEKQSPELSKGKPLNLKEFLTRELLKRSTDSSRSNSSLSQTHDSTLASQFLRSLLGSSDSALKSPPNGNLLQNSEKHNTQRTSTPVKQQSTLVAGDGTSGAGSPTKSSNNNPLFSGESGLSSVRGTSMSSSGKETNSSMDDNVSGLIKLKFDKLAVPELNLNLPSKGSTSSST